MKKKKPKSDLDHILETASEVTGMFYKKKVPMLDGVVASLFVAFFGMKASGMDKKDADDIISLVYKATEMDKHFEKVSRETNRK